MMLFKNPRKIMLITRWTGDLDWRIFLFIIPSLSLVVYLSFSSISSIGFPSFNSLITFPSNRTLPPSPIPFKSVPSPVRLTDFNDSTENPKIKKMKELNRSRIAICLVGGARRFELTGPSIVEKVLQQYPNSDLFLHSPLDKDSFKFSLLKIAPRLATIRIFEPKHLQETESQIRVLTSNNSPNGIQGLIQYFNLVEGCFTMIKAYQKQMNITYDWIVRTRVDSYWSAPLDPDNFIAGQYLVPPGSDYGGLNDRLGLGDFNTSSVALSRLSLISKLDSEGLHQLNSEAAFKAQLTTQGVKYFTKRLPFCIISDRKYSFPPMRFGVPVASLASPGPLSGAKCRPCKPVCSGPCVADVVETLYKGWSWTEWRNGSLQLCDAHSEWEIGWEKIFDRVAGKKLAAFRKRINKLKVTECINDFEEMRRRTVNWDTPPVTEICKLGLDRKQ